MTTHLVVWYDETEGKIKFKQVDKPQDAEEEGKEQFESNDYVTILRINSGPTGINVKEW
jgi:hypothetical protein